MARTALVAAAAVLVLGGVAGGLALAGDDPGAVGAGDAPASPTPAEQPAPEEAPPATAGDPEETPGSLTTLSLSAPAPAAGARCRMVSAEALATLETAFAGTVTEVGEDAVSFEVDRWYAGGEVDRVEVLNPPGFGAALEGSPELEAGQRYLVTAAQGRVTACGFTAPYSAALERKFERAFS